MTPVERAILRLTDDWTVHPLPRGWAVRGVERFVEIQCGTYARRLAPLGVAMKLSLEGRAAMIDAALAE